MMLSKHFTLDEMTYSEWATRHGIKNTPSGLIVTEMRKLCEEILEPVRELLDRPIHISSGYRNPEVNAGIGGSPTSQHMRGQAADFVVRDTLNTKVIRAILTTEIPFDQLILEFGNAGWVHISRSDTPRGEVFRAVKDADNKTQYIPW